MGGREFFGIRRLVADTSSETDPPLRQPFHETHSSDVADLEHVLV